MQVAIIPPKKHVRELAGGRGFHLVLYHELINHLDLRTIYQEFARRGDYIVLDNSAHELGSGQDVLPLYQMAVDYGFKEIVLPDSLWSMPETVERSVVAMDELLHAEIDLTNVNLMFVPQGKSIAEWEICFETLLQNFLRRFPDKRPVLGVSKDYEVWEGGLVNLFRRFVHDRRELLDIHLLGWGRDHRQLSALAYQFPYIRSTDSAKPVVYGISYVSLDLSRNSPEYPGRPENYFSYDMNARQLELSMHNIQVFEKRANPIEAANVETS